ncbi:MAG: hydroxymethylbilane synthase [Deltaproteobacteria bacterium]|jgi:hydroxymethylbilane synthase|nr:hydroxymethylbilane synthase [Deltaproteobacteria bacterium]
MRNSGRKIVLATRGSPLALRQAGGIRDLIREKYPGFEPELAVVKTRGDLVQDKPLAALGGKGLFVREIEEALLQGRADLAVHSVKDLPADLPPGLVLGVVPPGESPEDVLLSVNYAGLEDLPEGARVGTGSLRRRAQLLALRPDLRLLDLRGNVDTRLRRLREGDFEAVVLALAGLRRLGLRGPRESVLPPEIFLPACGQGALGLEYMEEREDLAELLAFMEHRPTRRRVEAERAFLRVLGGNCQTPIAAHTSFPQEGTLLLDGLVASADGVRVIRGSVSGRAAEAEGLGRELAERILAAGGGEILF